MDNYRNCQRANRSYPQILEHISTVIAHSKRSPNPSPSIQRNSSPPLPPRRTSYSSSQARYPAYGMGMYDNYSPMSSMYPRYRNYGMSSYGPYGMHPDRGYNAFIQMAEESTRPAFESIESVVEVFGSISMMLESTYHAVRSSYSAILGVVDQFSRLKDHLAGILSVLALLRTLRWLCYKILYLLNLRKDNPAWERTWNSVKGVESTSPIPASGGRSSAWPFLMFLGLVVGAPWLMFKLLSKATSKRLADKSMFCDEDGRMKSTIAAYDFRNAQYGELPFRAGEKLYICLRDESTPVPKGWVMACNSRREMGLVPTNHLHPPKMETDRAKPTPISEEEDAHSDECSSEPIKSERSTKSVDPSRELDSPEPS